jgi:mRNA-degrading endonuclease RelE of RelBE toxin-antitoxin system
MAWRIILKPQMERQLKKLRQKQTQLEQEVLKVHLPKIAQAPYSVGKHLKGQLRCVWRYALGHRPEYRIIYEIKGNEVHVLDMDTRENIYG